MKKLALLLLTVTSFVFIFTLAGCNNNDSFTKQSYSSCDSKINAIAIDVQDRDVTVSVSNDSQVHIGYYESQKEYYNISIVEETVLKVNLLNNKEWHDFIGTKPSAEYRKITIEVPHSLLSNLSIITTNGVINLSPIIVADSVLLSSNGGNIEFEQINIGNAVTLDVKNGNINGTIIGSYDMFSIICEIKKGECNLPLQKLDGEKSLKANCNNGDIEINFVKS